MQIIQFSESMSQQNAENDNIIKLSSIEFHSLNSTKKNFRQFDYVFVEVIFNKSEVIVSRRVTNSENIMMQDENVKILKYQRVKASMVRRKHSSMNALILREALRPIYICV
jgi:hypothetical protein